ncbi:TPA: phosphoserine phosphatase SerB [Candidatus Bathyarchaeota archaeon]|nr:phosphoserine phosphatase SerB [Candidatus Bathyarchaeota archaeon]
MLIALDLEGTLLDGELFPEIGLKLGLGGELGAITRDAMSGDLPFEKALRRRVELIRGVPMSSIRSVADTIPLTRGAEETIQILRHMGLTPAIITGGFDFLARRAADRLQIDHVYANHFAEKDGMVAGLASPVVTPRVKAEHLKRLAGELGVPLGRCVAVGDGANDIPMLCTAGLSVAFNAPPRVREAACVVVAGNDLRAILPLVARHLDETPAQVHEAQLVQMPTQRMGR